MTTNNLVIAVSVLLLIFISAEKIGRSLYEMTHLYDKEGNKLHWSNWFYPWV